MVSGQTIKNRSAGVVADGGDESSLSGLRSIVTTRLADMVRSAWFAATVYRVLLRQIVQRVVRLFVKQRQPFGGLHAVVVQFVDVTLL